MRIERKMEFQPITITLETKEDAELFLELLRHSSNKRQGAIKKLANRLLDWFGAEAHLTEAQENMK